MNICVSWNYTGKISYYLKNKISVLQEIPQACDLRSGNCARHINRLAVFFLLKEGET